MAPRPLLIGLIGKARSGKDTAASALIAERGFTRVAFADPVRALALSIDPLIPAPDVHHRLSTLVRFYGWEVCKDSFPEVRRILQHVGNGYRENVSPTAWTDMARPVLTNRTGPIVVTDVRYRNEADLIRDLGGDLIRIVRPGTQAGTHVSETELDDYPTHVVLHNTGDVDFLTSGILRITDTIAALAID